MRHETLHPRMMSILSLILTVTLITLSSPSGQTAPRLDRTSISQSSIQVPADSDGYSVPIYTAPAGVQSAIITATATWADDWYPNSTTSASAPALVEMPFAGGNGCDFITNHPENNYAYMWLNPQDRLAEVTVSIEVGPGKSVAIAGSDCGLDDNFHGHYHVTWQAQTTPPATSTAGVRLTNVRDTTFTVSWITHQPTTGEVHYGIDPANLNQIAHDDRGAATSDDTHHVTVTGLTPETTYYFGIVVDGLIDDNDGVYDTVTTGPALVPPVAIDTIYGTVLKADGTTPAEGPIVYISLRSADGSGSPGQAAPLSALTDNAGAWLIDLANARTADLAGYFEYTAAGDKVRLEVQGAADGEGCQVVGTANDAPATDVVLNVSRCGGTIELESGWNLVSLPVIPVIPYTAESACQEINRQGGDVTHIERWGVGDWDSHFCGLPADDFPLELGEGYFIYSNVESTWTIVGEEVMAPVTLNLRLGWNAIGVPHTNRHTAESLCDDLTAQGATVLEINRWYADGWDGHVCNVPVNDFAIEIGRGYLLNTTTDGPVVPSDAGLETGDVEPASLKPAAFTAPVLSPMGPTASVAIRDLRVSDLRGKAFTVSWSTDRPAPGHIVFGETPGLGQVAYDVRGPAVMSDTHYVVITDLTEETTYYFDIASGAHADDNDGEHYTVTTGISFESSKPPSDNIWGQVFRNEGTTPASDTIVYLTLKDADGAGTPGEALLMSALVEPSGYWIANLGNARLADGRTVFDYSPAGDLVTLEAQGANAGVATATFDTFDLRPAAPLRLVPTLEYYLPLIKR